MEIPPIISELIGSVQEGTWAFLWNLKGTGYLGVQLQLGKQNKY